MSPSTLFDRLLVRLEAAAWASADPDHVEAIARACAAVHDIAPLRRPEGLRGTGTPLPSDVVAFATQFATDVAALGEAPRAAFVAALGADAPAYAQIVYVADMVARARAVLARLDLGPDAESNGAHRPAPDDSLAAAIGDLIQLVPGLQSLDAITTELVRLRGARAHNCRLCKSLRSYSALAAGADEEVFQSIDRYETSELSAAHKAALAFTDAIVWTPGRLSDELVAALRAHWSRDQQIELVADIVRNATNKLAVALGGDAPHVTEGIEVYDVAADGTITYGLAAPTAVPAH